MRVFRGTHNLTTAKLKALVDDYGSLVVGTHFGGSKGHVMGLRSYDNSGYNVNDPAGNLALGYFNRAGENVHYNYSLVSGRKGIRYFGYYAIYFH